MPYFTTDELRALPDLSDAYEDRLQAAYDWIVGIVERECETSFIVSTATDERVTGTDLDYLRLENAYVRDITAITVDGVAYDAGQIAELYVEDGYLFAASSSTWPSTSRGNVVVTYTYGYTTTPPADLKQAMLRGARQWVLTTDQWSGADSRATSISNEYGNVQLTVASEERPTGIPDVDATIMAWRHKVRVPKVR